MTEVETVNDKQVGGTHYNTPNGRQHWDEMWETGEEYNAGWLWFYGAITKYIRRYRKKWKGNKDNQHKDLLKGLHYYLKLCDLEGVDKAKIKELVDD